MAGGARGPVRAANRLVNDTSHLVNDANHLVNDANHLVNDAKRLVKDAGGSVGDSGRLVRLAAKGEGGPARGDTMGKRRCGTLAPGWVWILSGKMEQV